MSILLACPPEGAWDVADLATSFGPILIGVLTVWVALSQLRQNREDTAKQRALETKREVLLGGVRGIAKMTRALADVANPKVPLEDTSRLFTDATADWMAASAVASIEVVQRGKEYLGEVAPKLIRLSAQRTQLEADLGDKIERSHYAPLALEVMAFAIESNPLQLRTIAAVRRDIQIKDGTDERFIAAAAPDYAKIRKLLGIGEPAAE